MTQQEIQERNQQVALMLGWERHNHASYFTWTTQNSKDHFYESILQFHSDWNWLMEAVEFIQKELIKNGDEFCIEFYEGCFSEPVTFVSYGES